MASRGQKIFEELGFTQEQEVFVNPYSSLGIDPDFARQLLSEDKSGEALQSVVTSMYRALSTRYHPDIPTTGDHAKFRTIGEARERIQTATPASLSRWTKVERSAGSSFMYDKLKVEHEALRQRSADTMQNVIDAGRNPTHYAHFSWAAGLLIQRGNLSFLVQQRNIGGISVTQGMPYESGKAAQTAGLKEKTQHAFDFQMFLRHHDFFGIKPDTKIAAFVDRKGQTSILNSDLSFMMNVSHPVSKYREARTKMTAQQIQDAGNSDNWTQASSPLLFITKTPMNVGTDKPDTKIIAFPHIDEEKSGRVTTYRDLDYDVVGSVADEAFFKKVRHVKNTGRSAISASQNLETLNCFKLLATTYSSLVEQGASYTPLMTPGNSMLLYNSHDGIPVLTDAKVVGLIGNNADAF